MLSPRIGTAASARVQVGDGAVKRLSSRPWARIRAYVLSHEPLCRMCKAEGRTTEATEVDHVRPLVMGGSNDWDNLQPLCHEHHAEKSAREFAVLNGRLDDDSVIAVY